MRKFLHVPLFLLLLFFAGISCKQPLSDADAGTAGDVAGSTAPTTVYVVRHAEKVISDPKDQNPDLSPEGKARAEALRDLLQEVQVDGLYSTKYTRTRNTLKPLAEARNLQIVEYSANDFLELKERLLQEHPGQTVVVAGHSNTVLPMLEAFGAETRITHIPETEYSYIFKVVMSPDKPATLEVRNYNN